MKRWLDALLSRWYVPHGDVISYRRGVWTVTRNEYGYSMSECHCNASHDGPCISSSFVVTTDYSKGCPCS